MTGYWLWAAGVILLVGGPSAVRIAGVFLACAGLASCS